MATAAEAHERSMQDAAEAHERSMQDAAEAHKHSMQDAAEAHERGMQDAAEAHERSMREAEEAHGQQVCSTARIGKNLCLLLLGCCIGPASSPSSTAQKRAACRRGFAGSLREYRVHS